MPPFDVPGSVEAAGGGGLRNTLTESNQPATISHKKPRKRDRFLQLLRPHSRSRGVSPNPLGRLVGPSGSVLQASSPNPPSSVLQQAPSPNPSSSLLPPLLLQSRSSSPNPSSSTIHQAAPHDLSGSSDLWAKAYHKLPDELKEHLKPEDTDKLQTLQNVLKIAILAKEANVGNRLKLKYGDKEIDVEEAADRLVGWIMKFKEVGDIAMQYDPAHAALPWAGVRSILLVCHTIPCL